MIEKMKKITLLVAKSELDRDLLALRKAGVVHIEPVKGVAVKSSILVEKQLVKIEKAVNVLSSYTKTGEKTEGKGKEAELLEKAGEIETAFVRKENLIEKEHILQKEEKWFEIWGNFDPAELEPLEKKGLGVNLYKLRKEDYIKHKDDVQLIRKDKNEYYVALLSFKEIKTLDQEEIHVPEISPKAIRREKQWIAEELVKIEMLFKESAKVKGHLLNLKEVLEKRHEFLSVKFGMQGEGEFSYLQGFCPEKEMKKVKTLAEKEKFGYMIEEPENVRDTPTYITTPKWARMIRPVFKFMNTVPGYEEFDISVVFLFFFSLFFAMLIGDAGYGLIFLVTTGLAHKKFKKAPKEPFFLMYVLAGSTILWGLITGTWFGSVQIAELPVFNRFVIERISSFGADNQKFMILLSFFIGAVHLTVARLIRVFRWINSPVAIAEIGWISIIWGMFYAAGLLVIGRAFPSFAGWLLMGGSLTVLLFANFQKNVLKGILATLADLPLSFIGAFSDVVSYLRLFAVGYASVVLAENFNMMAIGGGITSVFGGVIAALILFMGHTLNIVLALMAVLVHGIRLNLLEFSGQLGMQWSGKEYKPFKEGT